VSDLGSRPLRDCSNYSRVFGVQVIEVAKEFIEAVNSRQELVAIAEMVLAILEGHVAGRLEQFGQRGILFVQADGRSRQPDLGQTGADRTLPKTVQGILRHAKIQTTLDLYTQEDSEETRAAQGKFLAAMGMKTEAIQ